MRGSQKMGHISESRLGQFRQPFGKNFNNTLSLKGSLGQIRIGEQTVSGMIFTDRKHFLVAEFGHNLIPLILSSTIFFES
jgi:hypothetical protein